MNLNNNMNLNNPQTFSGCLFNPFTRLAGLRALWLGLGAIAAAALIGFFARTHFDGVLDTHTGAEAPLWFFVAEGIIDWVCLAATLLVLGRLISKTAFRSIDVFGTQALARWPALLIGLITLPAAYRRFGEYLAAQFTGAKAAPFSTGDAIVFALGVIAMIPCLCWMVMLMYRAFAICCNVKGAKAVGTFIIGVLVAETLSKIAVLALYQAMKPPHI